MPSDYLSLKWGTLKGWRFDSQEAIKAATEYAAFGMSMGAMQQHDTPEQKEALCRLIDAVNCDVIHLDWDGKDVTKDEAKRYVMDYGK